MAIRVYLKANNSFSKKVIGRLSYISLIIGSLLLFWSFYPVISFEIYSRLFIKKDTVSPVTSSELVSFIKQENSILGSYNIFSNNLRDFTQAHLWFPNSTQKTSTKIFDVKEYYLSIPKINITNAKVTIGGEDLSKSLVHYLPKSLPGEYGNIAIFGHSTLPQLYDVNDYKTIFTYLPSVEKGNKIIIHYKDLNYEYEVMDMFVVNPDKISILDQRYDAAYLTLVTCVPPGTFWKRLVVRAKLVQLP